jgi:acyl-CoA synthetase (AMP-forming)/AMP-acid ligase II
MTSSTQPPAAARSHDRSTAAASDPAVAAAAPGAFMPAAPTPAAPTPAAASPAAAQSEASAAAWPLLAVADPDTPLAWRAGQPLSRRRYLADLATLAARLPAHGPVLALSIDRYRFALALGAAVQRGQYSLLPPNHTTDMVERLKRLHPQAYALVDPDAPQVALPRVAYADPDAPESDAAWATAADTSAAATGMAARGAVPGTARGDAGVEPAMPQLRADTVVAEVLTSGSTGEPTRHAKRWGLLVENIGAEAERVAASLGLDPQGRGDAPPLAGVTLVGTVPAHHMYGFESTVLLALLGGAAFAAERPFFPADIVQVLAGVPRPRVLVTTPFHLKTLLDAGLALPPVDLTVCATAPLSPQLAARAEAALGGPLMEIYGCTEAGQVATRRTTAGPEWTCFRGLQMSGDGAESVVSGGHVPEPTPLADVLEVLSPTRFRLLGRANDLINVAGKRSSISHLNYHLNSIEGVLDGAFWLPPADGEAVVRLVAFVVAPGLAREQLLSELRLRVDPAFLPRRIVMLGELPRDPTGKLPASRLALLAGDHGVAPAAGPTSIPTSGTSADSSTDAAGGPPAAPPAA